MHRFNLPSPVPHPLSYNTASNYKLTIVYGVIIFFWVVIPTHAD